MQPTEARPKEGGEPNATPQVREEPTVVQIPDPTDKELNAQLKEKSENINVPQFSENGERDINSQDPINFPQFSVQLNSEIIGINDPEKSSTMKSVTLTTKFGVNSIYGPRKSTNSIQGGEAAHTKTNANTSISNPMSREEFEVARVTKKNRHVDTARQGSDHAATNSGCILRSRQTKLLNNL